jgi:hypothetical protein
VAVSLIGGDDKPEYPEKTIDKLYSFITRIPTANGAHLWIGGDFNLGDINWEKETVNEYATNGTQCNPYFFDISKKTPPPLPSVLSLRYALNPSGKTSASRMVGLSHDSVPITMSADSTIYESSNSFTILSDTMHSDISFSNPAATSSPTKSTQQQLLPQKRKDVLW